MSSAYLRLVIFLPLILIPACASSSPAFFMMYSAYKLNKQGDNIQPYTRQYTIYSTPFPIWNPYTALYKTIYNIQYSFSYLEPFCFPCPVLTVASWPAYRFLRRQVMWSGIPISLRIFRSCDPHSQRLWRSQ